MYQDHGPPTFQLVNPLEPTVPLSGLERKENVSVGKSMRNLDAKCEVQMCAYTFCS